MEELTDLTSNSISGKDKIIASRAVDALKDFAVEYLDSSRRVGGLVRRSATTSARTPTSSRWTRRASPTSEARRTWVEWKVMRQYLGIYNEALARCATSTTSSRSTRGTSARPPRKARTTSSSSLVCRYMNSYMRATLNAKDVRTAYNVLNQYRLLVEALLRAGQRRPRARGRRHMKYYGNVSYDMKLSFVTETVAYDVGALCQVAHELGIARGGRPPPLVPRARSPARASADRAGAQGRPQGAGEARRLLPDGGRGGRRAASATTWRCRAARAASRAIRDELERVETKDFWEIIDRGRNFEFMPDAQRKSPCARSSSGSRGSSPFRRSPTLRNLRPWRASGGPSRGHRQSGRGPACSDRRRP
jgi:hypothetical protein